MQAPYATGTTGTFKTGNGTLRGEVIGHLMIGRRVYCRVLCEFGAVRALAPDEFDPFVMTTPPTPARKRAADAPPSPLDSLPDPTPAAVKAARTAAGHSLAQAAALVGLANRGRWWDYEQSASQIDRARWALYLLATGQHPSLRLRPSPRTRHPAPPAP